MGVKSNLEEKRGKEREERGEIREAPDLKREIERERKRRREKERKTQRESRNRRGVDIVATNVTAATVPTPRVTSTFEEKRGKKEREGKRGKERETINIILSTS